MRDLPERRDAGTLHYPTERDLARNCPSGTTVRGSRALSAGILRNSTEERSMLRMIVLVAIGWIVGLSARALMPGKGPDGFWATTGVGVGGALMAVVIGRFAGWWHPGRCARIHPVASRRDHAAGALSCAQDQIVRIARRHSSPLLLLARLLRARLNGLGLRRHRRRFRQGFDVQSSSSAGRTLTSTDNRCPACPLYTPRTGATSA